MVEQSGAGIDGRGGIGEIGARKLVHRLGHAIDEHYLVPAAGSQVFGNLEVADNASFSKERRTNLIVVDGPGTKSAGIGEGSCLVGVVEEDAALDKARDSPPISFLEQRSIGANLETVQVVMSEDRFGNGIPCRGGGSLGQIPVGQFQPAKAGQEREIAKKRLAEIGFRTIKPGDRLKMGIGQSQVRDAVDDQGTCPAGQRTVGNVGRGRPAVDEEEIRLESPALAVQDGEGNSWANSKRVVQTGGVIQVRPICVEQNRPRSRCRTVDKKGTCLRLCTATSASLAQVFEIRFASPKQGDIVCPRGWDDVAGTRVSAGVANGATAGVASAPQPLLHAGLPGAWQAAQPPVSVPQLASQDEPPQPINDAPSTDPPAAKVSSISPRAKMVFLLAVMFVSCLELSALTVRGCGAVVQCVTMLRSISRLKSIVSLQTDRPELPV